MTRQSLLFDICKNLLRLRSCDRGSNYRKKLPSNLKHDPSWLVPAGWATTWLLERATVPVCFILFLDERADRQDWHWWWSGVEVAKPMSTAGESSPFVLQNHPIPFYTSNIHIRQVSYCSSLAAATPVKYECYSLDIWDTLTKADMFPMENSWVEQYLVIPHSELLIYIL